MPRKISEYESTEQPLHWGKSIFAGILGTWIMLAVSDIFAMMGLTSFSMEMYVGTVLRGTLEGGPLSWLVGFIANCVIGGVIGIFYGFAFESVFRRADSRTGVFVGAIHTVVAGVAILPFFQIVHEQMGLNLYPSFGFMGSGINAVTPLVLILGHLLFGATMGTFYGPVRLSRIRARDFEHAEHGLPGERGVVDQIDDPRDKTAIGYY